MIRRAVFGAPGARRHVVILEEGVSAPIDPEPAVSAAHDVVVLAILVADAAEDTDAERDVLAGVRAVVCEFVGGCGGPEDPSAAGARAEQALPAEALPDHGAGPTVETFGLVGVGTGGGRLAVALAAELGDRVDRLALVAVDAPSGLAADSETRDLEAVRARTLVVNGADDPRADGDAARWHGERLARVHVDVVAGADAGLALASVWDAVLEHLAPGTPRR